MSLINRLYITYISTCELWKISMAITSIIKICCLVEEGWQWFFLDVKLCLEIHCHSPGIFCWAMPILSHRYRNGKYRDELLESCDWVVIVISRPVDGLGAYLLLENPDLSWGYSTLQWRLQSVLMLRLLSFPPSRLKAWTCDTFIFHASLGMGKKEKCL